jgi:hypothetical protein
VDNNAEYKHLKQEKRRLQIFLHEYQNDFIAKHGRKVQTREDREPAQHEYERYRVHSGLLVIANTKYFLGYQATVGKNGKRLCTVKRGT